MIRVYRSLITGPIDCLPNKFLATGVVEDYVPVSEEVSIDFPISLDKLVNAEIKLPAICNIEGRR
jgi:hypothetical protein